VPPLIGRAGPPYSSVPAAFLADWFFCFFSGGNASFPSSPTGNTAFFFFRLCGSTTRPFFLAVCLVTAGPPLLFGATLLDCAVVTIFAEFSYFGRSSF